MIHQKQQEAEHRLLGNGGIDDKDRIKREEKAQKQTIEKGLMVGDDKKPILRNFSIVIADFHPKEQSTQGTEYCLEKAIQERETITERQVGRGIHRFTRLILST